LNRAPSSASSDSRVPRHSPGCNVRSLPIGPQEAFLLSRIDGSITEREIVMLTGFDATTVATLIDRLHELGAILLDEPAKIPVVTSPIAESSAMLYDPHELDSPADLEVAKKKEILQLFAQLDVLTYYELLGVEPNTEKKDLRHAYYARAPAYHPDKFFGKNLGTFKSKMEAVFGRLTVAYETLSNADRRAEYDSYLATQREIATMEQLLHGPVVVDSSQPPRPASTPVASQPSPLAAPTVVSQPPPLAAPTVASQPPPLAVPTVAPTSKAPLASMPPRTPEEARARREALARKLRSSLPPDAQRGSGAPPNSIPPETALKDLVRRRDAAMADGQRLQVRRYVDAAKAATEQKNLAAAANAYRLALATEPDNPELIRAYQEAARIASAALADGYLKQADYEARAGKWVDAARSYTRAAAGMPDDANVHEKAAQALLQAGGDMHAAVDLAQRAVSLAPKKLDPHLTLAEIYLHAGRGLLARREIDAAREIGPQDARIKELSKRLR
jgi:curved DNA-binding protein CbpA